MSQDHYKDFVMAGLQAGQDASQEGNQTKVNETQPKSPLVTRRAQQTDKVLETLAFIITQAGCGMEHKLEAARIYSDLLKVRVL